VSGVIVLTEFTYTPDSQIKTLTAKMSSPARDEVTTYVYGVSPATGSQLTVNNLLLATEYPEDTSTKREEYAYNRQQERIEKTDQNGTVHGYDFDVWKRVWKRGQVQFAGTARRVLRSNWTCPLFTISPTHFARDLARR